MTNQIFYSEQILRYTNDVLNSDLNIAKTLYPLEFEFVNSIPHIEYILNSQKYTVLASYLYICKRLSNNDYSSTDIKLLLYTISNIFDKILKSKNNASKCNKFMEYINLNLIPKSEIFPLNYIKTILDIFQEPQTLILAKNSRTNNVYTLLLPIESEDRYIVIYSATFNSLQNIKDFAKLFDIKYVTLKEDDEKVTFDSNLKKILH